MYRLIYRFISTLFLLNCFAVSVLICHLHKLEVIIGLCWFLQFLFFELPVNVNKIGLFRYIYIVDLFSEFRMRNNKMKRSKGRSKPTVVPHQRSYTKISAVRMSAMPNNKRPSMLTIYLLNACLYRKPLIPRTAFERLVREIASTFKSTFKVRFQRDVILALQINTEDYLIGLFKKINWQK